MLRSVYILVLLALQLAMTSGFVVTPTVTLRIQETQHVTERQKTHLMAELEKEDMGTPAEDLDAAPKAAPPKIVPKIAEALFLLVTQTYSVFLVAFGSLSLCGLLLNLFGYGYHFTKNGFEVDTIEHMRLENQFAKEYKRMSSEIKPPSSLPQ